MNVSAFSRATMRLRPRALCSRIVISDTQSEQEDRSQDVAIASIHEDTCSIVDA